MIVNLKIMLKKTELATECRAKTALVMAVVQGVHEGVKH